MLAILPAATDELHHNVRTHFFGDKAAGIDRSVSPTESGLSDLTQPFDYDRNDMPHGMLNLPRRISMTGVVLSMTESNVSTQC